MSSRLEFEGKNVETAVQNACRKLDIKEDKLRHEVLSYGSTGIFGLVGFKKARISVILPETMKPEQIKPEQIMIDKKEKVEKKDYSAESPENGPEKTEPNDITIPVDMEEMAQLGKDILEKIARSITDDIQVTVDIQQTKIGYSINGGNSSILIGKRGQTLEAIHYLVEKIINKKADSRVKIQIDVEGYLENRKKTLKDMANKMSLKAKTTGKPITVGNMTANDRRIIHVALKNDKKVHTKSIGDGAIRKIIIFPKKRQNNKKKSDNN